MPTKGQLIALGFAGTGGVAGVTVPLTYKYWVTDTSRQTDKSSEQQVDNSEEKLKQFLRDKNCYTVIKNKSEEQLIVCQANQNRGSLIFYFFSKTNTKSLENPIYSLTVSSGTNNTEIIDLKHTNNSTTTTLTGFEKKSNLDGLNGFPLSTICTEIEKGRDSGEKDKTYMTCRGDKKEITKLESSSLAQPN